MSFERVLYTLASGAVGGLQGYSQGLQMRRQQQREDAETAERLSDRTDRRQATWNTVAAPYLQAGIPVQPGQMPTPEQAAQLAQHHATRLQKQELRDSYGDVAAQIKPWGDLAETMERLRKGVVDEPTAQQATRIVLPAIQALIPGYEQPTKTVPVYETKRVAGPFIPGEVAIPSRRTQTGTREEPMPLFAPPQTTKVTIGGYEFDLPRDQAAKLMTNLTTNATTNTARRETAAEAVKSREKLAADANRVRIEVVGAQQAGAGARAAGAQADADRRAVASLQGQDRRAAGRLTAKPLTETQTWNLVDAELRAEKPGRAPGSTATGAEIVAYEQQRTAYQAKRRKRFAEIRAGQPGGAPRKRSAAEIGAAVGAAIRAAQEGK